MSISSILRQDALEYHAGGKPGKIEVKPTKSTATQRDLSLAYSPGVAEPCLEIAENVEKVYDYTAKGNLVGVISNGTAVLGLGNIGPEASKPVMEGKGVLFKVFSDIDVFDIELAVTDPDDFVDTVARLEPTFGGINLEDIKSPECFEIEEKLKARLKIPIMHDDQHGTAIISSAALLNALEIVDKKIEEARFVISGAGAAAISCVKLYLKLGARIENFYIFDKDGLVSEDRPDLNRYLAPLAGKAGRTATMAEAMKGADVFLGLSVGGILKPEMVATMAANPIVFAMANPDPEISYEDAIAVRKDIIMATGRTDYPNQVNNVLCFPFIFRGALDVGATQINDEMQIACIEGIAALARATTSAEAAAAYRGEKLTFGTDYLIPKPFDPRLIGVVATAVAKAAMESGVATRPLADIAAYKQKLDGSVFKSAMLMRPVFEAAATATRKIVFAEGEDERVLRAANAMMEETTDRPILIGRPEVIEMRCERAGLPLNLDNLEIVNPENDPRYRDYWETYHQLMARRGVSPDLSRAIMRTNTTAIAAIMVHRNEADSMICGTFGQYHWHLKYVREVLARDGLHPTGALSLMILEDGPLFVADTHIHHEPTPEEITATVMELSKIAEATRHEVNKFDVN